MLLHCYFVGDFLRLRDASLALDILDIDGDGSIGLLDFIHFASRLQALYKEGRLRSIFHFKKIILYCSAGALNLDTGVHST